MYTYCSAAGRHKKQIDHGCALYTHGAVHRLYNMLSAVRSRKAFIRNVRPPFVSALSELCKGEAPVDACGVLSLHSDCFCQRKCRIWNF